PRFPDVLFVRPAARRSRYLGPVAALPGRGASDRPRPIYRTLERALRAAGLSTVDSPTAALPIRTGGRSIELLPLLPRNIRTWDNSAGPWSKLDVYPECVDGNGPAISIISGMVHFLKVEGHENAFDHLPVVEEIQNLFGTVT